MELSSNYLRISVALFFISATLFTMGRVAKRERVNLEEAHQYCTYIMRYQLPPKNYPISPTWIAAYRGRDYPRAWPLPPLGPVHLSHEDSVHYSLETDLGVSEWNATLPSGGTVIHLGPDGRPFTVSMFHQLHCLDKMRRAVVSPPSSEWESWHTQHCLNYVRQMLLCAASVRLEPVKVAPGKGQEGLKVDGLGLQHECRDWSALREAVEANHERWESDV